MHVPNSVHIRFHDSFEKYLRLINKTPLLCSVYTKKMAVHEILVPMYCTDNQQRHWRTLADAQS